MDVINVTIKNLTGRDKLLTWLPKGQKWLQANKTVTIPYEPWGLANSAQREAMAAAVLTGGVSFTLYAMGTDGQVHAIPYNPAYGVKLTKVNDKPKTYVKKPDMEFMADSKKHTITTGGGARSIYAEMGFRSEEVQPPSSTTNDSSQKGFIKTATGNTDRIRAMMSQEQETPEVEDDNSANIKDAFEALVDSKQWDAALQLLKDTFGEDKVTFNVRTVMSMKSFDAIASKYNL